MKHYMFIGVWLAFLAVLVSCSTGEAMIEDAIPGARNGSASPPLFIGCKPVSAERVEFEFSVPVTVKEVRFSPELETVSVEDGQTAAVNLARAAAPGERIAADMLVEDEYGNTLNVLVPFHARNDRIPAMLINELRTERNADKEKAKYNEEFIEFRIQEEGNLAAVRLFIASNTKQPLIYDFPSVEAAAGEYVVLHLRTEEENARDELSNDKTESGGTDATGSRDLWVTGSSKLLRKTDAVYLLDQDDRVIDAVMLSETPGRYWKDHFADAEKLLTGDNAWIGKGPDGAVPSADIKTAMTRSICRDENAPDTNSAADWYICNTGGISIGAVNSAVRYTPPAK